MVSHVHPLLSLLALQAWWSLLRARETPICRRKRRFPHLRELVEDVGDGSLVGVVVHEDDDALAGEDHCAEWWP